MRAPNGMVSYLLYTPACRVPIALKLSVTAPCYIRPVDPCLYLHRFANQAGREQGEVREAITNTALRLVAVHEARLDADGAAALRHLRRRPLHRLPHQWCGLLACMRANLAWCRGFPTTSPLVRVGLRMIQCSNPGSPMQWLASIAVLRALWILSITACHGKVSNRKTCLQEERAWSMRVKDAMQCRLPPRVACAGSCSSCMAQQCSEAR